MLTGHVKRYYHYETHTMAPEQLAKQSIETKRVPNFENKDIKMYGPADKRDQGHNVRAFNLVQLTQYRYSFHCCRTIFHSQCSKSVVPIKSKKK